MSRGLEEDIRSRFVTDNKSSVLIDRKALGLVLPTPRLHLQNLLFHPGLDQKLTQETLKARVCIPTVLLIIQISKKKKRNKMSNLEKRLGNLLNKLRMDENSVLFAKGDKLNEKSK